MKNLSLTFCLAIAALFGSVGGGFATNHLPLCKGSYNSSTWTNCIGTETFANGNKFVGDFRDGERNGQGTFTLANGDKYVGEFIDDKTHGQGIYTWADGDKYVGDFRDGKRTGQGTYTHVNGDKHVGEYKDGKRTGQGTYTYVNGDKYVGEYKDDKRNGQGTHTWAKSGNKYVGEFRDGDFNGQGTYTYANGTVEEGIWKDDEFQYAKKLSPPVPVAKTPTQDDEVISASSGSGFAVSSDGYVITNHHVIEGCQKTEAFSLRHQDISANKDGTITLDVVGKTGPRKSNSTPSGSEIYEELRQCNPDYNSKRDFLFFPKIKNREFANRTTQRIFNHLLKVENLKYDKDGNARTMYSLRHYAIHIRLEKSKGKVNIFLLAKNAGTSVNQLERFYLKYMELTEEERQNLNTFAGG